MFLCAAVATGAGAADEKGLAPTAKAYYLYSLAQQDRFERRYLDAVDHLKRAITHDPTSAVLHLELGRLFWQLRDRERAIEEGETAARLDPENTDAHRFLATTYSALVNGGGQRGASLERAIFHHERTLDLDDSEQSSTSLLALGQLYQHAGRHEDATRALEDYLEREDPTTNSLFWLSKAYAARGQLDRSADRLRRALELSPRSVQLLEALADLEQQRRNLPGAVDAMRALLRVAPDNLPQYLRLGELLGRSGDVDGALEVYGQGESVARERGDEEARAFLRRAYWQSARIMLDQGRVDEAGSWVDQGRLSFEDDLSFAVLHGEVAYRRGDAEAGRGVLDSLITDNPDNERLSRAVSDTYLRLGALEERSGSYDASVPLLERAVELNPDNDVALNYLGYLWADRGENLERSVELIRRALEVGGERAAYLDSLGWAYYRQGRYELAEPQLVRAVELDAEEPVILEHLGDLYHATGRPEDAVRTWRRALEAGHEDPDAVRRKIADAQGGEESSR